MKPFVKWAGGKTQLLDEINKRLPPSYNRYFEPFLGGGAVLLNLQPQKAFVNDINAELLNTYNQIKNNPDDFIRKMNEIDKINTDKVFYYKNRDRYNQKITNQEYDLEMAILFVWINKHCFNGLYRVNKKGLFNVPYNQKDIKSSIDEDNIRKVSQYLNTNRVFIKNIDFEVFLDSVATNDFVFVDSPYIPESDTSNFVDYSKTGFSEKDHQRLAKKLHDLSNKGVFWMLTNNDVPQIYDLYDDYNIESVAVRRNINSKGNKRSGQEVIIRNY